MVNTLFLEDGDLLENIMISNQIHESEIMEFDRLISEQEMMISIYENQQFLIEQDTQIFMRLRYNTEVLSEGVLENIGKGIMAVLRKIGELISNFIGFIFGRRKSEKSVEKEMKKVEDNEEKIVETIKETEKQLEDVKKDFKSSISIAKKADVDEDKILKTEEDIDNYFLGKQEELYHVIDIDQDTMRTLNITKKWSELEEMINVLEQCVNSLKHNDPNIPKSLSDKYENYKKSLKIQKDDLTTMLIVKGKCDRDTYYRLHHKNAKAFYRNYSDESIKNLDFLKKLNMRIDKLSKQIKNVQMYNAEKSTAWNAAATSVSKMVTSLSQDCNARIQTLVDVEKGYQAYKHNMKLTASQYVKLNNTTKKVSRDLNDINKDMKNKSPDDFLNMDFDELVQSVNDMVADTNRMLNNLDFSKLFK